MTVRPRWLRVKRPRRWNRPRRVARPSRQQRFAAFGIGPAPDYLASRAFTEAELDRDGHQRWIDGYRRLVNELPPAKLPRQFCIVVEHHGLARFTIRAERG